MMFLSRLVGYVASMYGIFTSTHRVILFGSDQRSSPTGFRRFGARTPMPFSIDKYAVSPQKKTDAIEGDEQILTCIYIIYIYILYLFVFILLL